MDKRGFLIPNIYRDSLKYALAIAGGERSLAERMNVTVNQLEIWLNGIEEIPENVFLRAVDVVTAATPEEIARSREALRKMLNQRA